MKVLEQNEDQLISGGIQGVVESFIVDAWLGNWDVVGLEYDNLLVQGDKAVRIDTGGALRYRAQGGLKNEDFGTNVPEIQVMRESVRNAEAASVFGVVTLGER